MISQPEIMSPLDVLRRFFDVIFDTTVSIGFDLLAFGCVVVVVVLFCVVTTIFGCFVVVVVVVLVVLDVVAFAASLFSTDFGLLSGVVLRVIFVAATDSFFCGNSVVFTDAMVVGLVGRFVVLDLIVVVFTFVVLF